MTELGVAINAWQSRGVNSITVKVCTAFRKPLRLSDPFYASSAVKSVPRSQLVLSEAVRRRSDDALVAVSLKRRFVIFFFFSEGVEVEVEGGGREVERGRRKKTKKELTLPLFLESLSSTSLSVLRGHLRDRRRRFQSLQNPGGGQADPREGRREVCRRERQEQQLIFLSPPP